MEKLSILLVIFLKLGHIFSQDTLVTPTQNPYLPLEIIQDTTETKFYFKGEPFTGVTQTQLRNYTTTEKKKGVQIGGVIKTSFDEQDSTSWGNNYLSFINGQIVEAKYVRADNELTNIYCYHCKKVITLYNEPEKAHDGTLESVSKRHSGGWIKWTKLYDENGVLKRKVKFNQDGALIKDKRHKESKN